MTARLQKIYLVLIIFACYISVSGQAVGARIIHAVDYSLDGNFIAFASGTLECNSADTSEFAVQIIDRVTHQIIQTIGNNNCHVSDLVWSPDSSQIALSSADGSASVWDIVSGEQIAFFAGSGFGIHSLDNIAWSPNGRYLIVDRIIWNPQTGNRIGSPLIDDNLIAGITYANTWSPCGNYLAFVTASQQLVIWDASHEDVSEWVIVDNFETGRVSEIDYSPDGQLIAVANSEQIQVFDSITGEVIKIFSALTLNFTDVEWSPDGNYLATGDSDGFVHIWEYSTQIEIETLRFPTPVFAIDWSPDGEEIAVGRRLNPNESFIDIIPIPNTLPISDDFKISS